MKPFIVAKNPDFIGREFEINRLKKIRSDKSANIIVVYGRRRVGKTELIEQFFSKDRILKFEGIQSDEENIKKRKQKQIDRCLKRLADYLDNPILKKVNCENWTDFFELLDPVIQKYEIVLYFEEIQWLSCYQSDFLAEMKPFWDDKWQHRKGLKIVLCGSSPSFFMSQLMGDKALYSRIHHEIHLQPFNLYETSQLLKKQGYREKMMAQLTVGGVVEYLKILNSSSSIYNSLAENSFLPNGYFVNEAQRIFVSNLSSNKHYKNIIEILSKKHYATRNELQKSLGIKSGGTLTNILNDLEICGFIEKIIPLHLSANSLLSKYTISDQYLNFYYKFIKHQKSNIQRGKYKENPVNGIQAVSFQKFLGFAFEKWARKNCDLFAKILNFSGVDYQAGAYFNRTASKLDSGFQIDLMYIRADHKILFCELKYYSQLVNTAKVFREIESKKEMFIKTNPKYKNYSFENILITTEGIPESQTQEFFDHVITFDDIFNKKYWE